MSHSNKLQPNAGSLKTKRLDLEDDVLLPIEVAKLLRVSRKTISRLTQRGELPSKKIGGQYRYSKTDLAEWLKGESI